MVNMFLSQNFCGTFAGIILGMNAHLPESFGSHSNDFSAKSNSTQLIP